MKTIRIAIGAMLLIQGLSQAAVVSVDMGSGSYTLTNQTNVPLTRGVAGVNGDGAQIFLGFYTDATLGNPFGSSDATFRQLSGVGNVFGTGNTTIGDYSANLAAAGEFFINGLLISDTTNPGLLPTPGTPLVVRVYDNTTVANSNYKMEFANSSLWKWISPTVPAPSILIDLDDANLFLLTNDQTRASTAISGGGPIATNIGLVPEPSRAILALVGMGLAFLRRRRN